MGSDLPEGLFFDFVERNEVPAAYKIEKTAFPPEEAASLEAFKTRQSVAPKLFLGAYTPTRTLIGYANATLAKPSLFTAESMHAHDPNGTSVCIHALAVAEPYRRNGVASALLKDYVRRLNDDPTIGDIRADRILLICHEDLIPLYVGVGFTLIGPSSVVHGPDAWFEMQIEIQSSVPPRPSFTQGDLPPNVLAELTKPSKNRPACRLFSSFPTSQALVSDAGENNFDILCPRSGCGSVILKAGVAKFQRGASVELEPSTHTPPPPLERLPVPPAETDWWLVAPSPMAFENVAFSRPVPSSPSIPTASQLKLLACAECDLGAFGWSKEGDREFWVAVSRVAYR